MDPDEIEPVNPCESAESAGRNVSGLTERQLPAVTPGGCAPGPSASDWGSRGASNFLTAIAAAIINSSVATHSAVVTVIVTVAVLAAALARE